MRRVGIGNIRARPLLRAAAPALRVASLWFIAAALSWCVVLSFEAYRHRADAESILGEVAYLSHLALFYSAFGSLPVLGIHAVRLSLGRFKRLARFAGLITSVAVGALALGPARDQAEFLTSGSGISAFEFRAPLKHVLLAAIVLGYVALWAWHLVGLRRASRLTVWLIVARAVWALLGVAAVAALVYTVSFKLKAYAFFAAFLVLPTWFAAATLGFSLLRTLPLSPRAALLSLFVLVGLARGVALASPREMARSRNTYVLRGKVAAWTDLLGYPSDTRSVSFEVKNLDALHCVPARGPAAPPPIALSKQERRNVLLISLDAVRADVLRWKVKGKPVMPNLLAFADKSLDYRRAVTTYPATLLAMGGALTGLGPSQLVLAPSVPPNLFSMTSGVFDTAQIFLPTSKWFRQRASKLLLLEGAKVSRHDDALAQTRALVKALHQARARRKSILAWVHYYEPHASYEKHKRYDYGDSERARYKSELSFVDRELQRLFSYLERVHFFDDGLVVVFADHGEAMGERDYYGHHVYLNSWVTDVPLLVRGPGVSARSSYAIADLTDVAATVLHFKGLPSPTGARGLSLLLPERLRRGRVSFAEAFPVRGKSLFRFAEPVEDLAGFQRRVARIHSGAKNYLPKVSAVTADYRLIVNRVTGLEELYDRTRDREERSELGFAGHRAQRRLREALERWSREQAELLYCAMLAPH